MAGHQNQVDMIGHQHPTPHRNIMSGAMLAQKVTIGRVAFVAEEGLLSPVTTLRHMVGRVGEDIAGEPGLSGLGIGQMIARQFRALSP
jgi:hypothetical protein